MKTGYSVADAMTTKPVVALPGTSVRDASALMREKEVGSLLIVDDYHHLLGIVTAEDIVYRVAALDAPPAATPISQVMTRDIVDISPASDIYEAIVTMREHDVYHLPVKDENKRLVGFLTLKDVLKIEPQLFEIMAEMAELSPERRLRQGGSEGYCEVCGNYEEEITKSNGKLLCNYCKEA